MYSTQLQKGESDNCRGVKTFPKKSLLFGEVTII